MRCSSITHVSIIIKNKSKLDKLANALIEKEILTADQIDEILGIKKKVTKNASVKKIVKQSIKTAVKKPAKKKNLTSKT